jgi:hypothetical protein
VTRQPHFAHPAAAEQLFETIAADLGLALEIAGAFAIARMEHSERWPDAAVR